MIFTNLRGFGCQTYIAASVLSSSLLMTYFLFDSSIWDFWTIFWLVISIIVTLAGLIWIILIIRAMIGRRR